MLSFDCLELLFDMPGCSGLFWFVPVRSILLGRGVSAITKWEALLYNTVGQVVLQK